MSSILIIFEPLKYFKMTFRNKIFRYILAGLLLSFFSDEVIAQPDIDMTNKIYFGGSFGAQFGNTTSLEVSPLVGYRINTNLSVGFGLSYIYYSYKDPDPAYSFLNFTSSIYGGRVFAKEYVFRNIFLYGEFEILNLNEPNPFTGVLSRKTTANPLMGGGFSQPMGGNSYIHFMILWDTNADVYSPYSNPIIRIGFTF